MILIQRIILFSTFLLIQSCHFDGFIIVPAMEVQIANLKSGSLQNSQSLVVAYSKELGEVDALLYCMDNEFSESMFFESNVFDIDQTSEIVLKFQAERRNISTPVIIVPIPTNDAHVKSRVMFLRFDNMNQVFRITIIGNAGNAEFADINSMKKLSSGLPSDLEKLKQEKAYNPTYWAKDRFYKKTKWYETDQIKVVRINRTDKLDLIKIRFN